MRRNWLFLFGWLLLAPILFGCRQTTGTSTLTPIGPLGSVGPLAPVGGGTAAAALSPLGQPTRVPPPSTGSYSAPNNYMGGAPADGQVYNQVAPYDSFSRVAPQGNVIGSGVAPTAFVEPIPGRPSSPSGTQANPNPLSPTLGGMRVIDMTQAPPPPGYRPSDPVQPYANATPPSYGTSGFGSQGPAGPYQPPYDVAPQNFGGTQGFGGTPGGQLQTIQVPGSRDIATGQYGTGTPPNRGNGASASIARREFPMQPSMTEPSFQGGNQFPSSQPSTEPIENSFDQQQRDLPWRRPGTQF